MVQGQERPIHVVGISGSVRKNSVNTGLLQAASGLLPEGMTLDIVTLDELPHYNQDLDVEGKVPVQVQALREQIRAADALLFAVPEYNYSVPGALKDAIDWASRPRGSSTLSGKPIAMMGAGGAYGTVRAQLHLRQIAVETNMLALTKPEVMVQRAWEKFEAQGKLTDEPTRQQVRELLIALAAWVRRLRGEQSQPARRAMRVAA